MTARAMVLRTLWVVMPVAVATGLSTADVMSAPIGLMVVLISASGIASFIVAWRSEHAKDQAGPLNIESRDVAARLVREAFFAKDVRHWAR